MNGLKDSRKTILIGIGNDGRSDDALGWLFADKFSKNDALEVVCRYQLQIEDAELISHFDTVIFVDASLKKLKEGYTFEKCVPQASVHFSTHKADPATILWLAKEVYGATTVGYILAIQGYHWELHQGLSDQAAPNLAKAISFFEKECTRPVTG